MTAPLVFLDTETTGVDPLNDDIWELAYTVRDTDGTETSQQLFVVHDANKALHLPATFRRDWAERFNPGDAVSSRVLVSALTHAIPAGAHLVGACPWFDQDMLRRHFDALKVKMPWHYHLIDVEALAVGSLTAHSELLEQLPETASSITSPPWDSDVLSRAVGVDPDRFDRHTAAGDVAWAIAIYDAVTK